MAACDATLTTTSSDTFEFNDLEAGYSDDLSPRAKGWLQANILTSARPIRSKQIFLRFKDQHTLSAWLRDKAPEPTTADADPEEYRNLLFTASGLRKCGVADAIIGAMDPAFTRGSLHPDTVAKLRDDPSTWGAHGREWDVVVVMGAAHANVSDELPAFARDEDCTVEHGVSLGADRQPLTQQQEARFGHFGYRDGISNPVYTQRDYARVEGDHDLARYDPRRALSTLLVRDPLAEPSTAFGSYLVFRKYHQDVRAFEARVESLADAIIARRAGAADSPAMGAMGAMGAVSNLGAVPLGDRYPLFRPFENGADREGLRALIHLWVMGRSMSGETAPGLSASAPLNGFNFAADTDGKRCPFHAHIRKVNPRGLTGDDALERSVAIARRGISYASPDAAGDRGLLFWCAQSSIGKQFEYIQQKWVNADATDVSLRPTPDADALIGRIDDTPFERTANPYPPGTTRYQRWKSTIDIDFNIWDTVRLQGSSYLFAPSLPGIQQLKASR